MFDPLPTYIGPGGEIYSVIGFLLALIVGAYGVYDIEKRAAERAAQAELAKVELTTVN